MKLYEALAQKIIDDIKAGRLPEASRLPSLRELAKQHSVSITNTSRSYQYLDDTGWIFSRPQSGFYVSSLHLAAKPPLLPDFLSHSRDPKAYAPSSGFSPTVNFFSPLGTAMVAPELLATTQIQRCIKRITARSQQTIHSYPQLQGNPVLRIALSDHFRSNHFPFHQADIVITNGCTDAVRHAITVVSQVGDTIAVSSPCYNGILDLISTLDRKIIEIPITENGLDLARLEQCMQQGLIKAALFNTSHMNPSGTNVTVEQKKNLVNLANKYQTPIIEDDVYIELSHQGKPPMPMKYWDSHGYVLWCGSISKTLAAGFRIGWCLPGRYLDQYKKQFYQSCLGVNGLMQAVLAEFIQTGEYRTHVNRLRLALYKQVNVYREFLKNNLPIEARISVPAGGMVLWVQIPKLNASDLEKAALEHGIDIRAGSKFSTYEHYNDCFRVNCGWPLVEKLNNIQSFASEQLNKICSLAVLNIALN